jgi:hypothetical protein
MPKLRARQTASRDTKHFPSSLLAGKVRREAGEGPNPALQTLYKYALELWELVPYIGILRLPRTNCTGQM